MRPQTDDYTQELEQVILALLSEGREAAAELLAHIDVYLAVGAASVPPEGRQQC